MHKLRKAPDKSFLPSPFLLAIILTIITFIAGSLVTEASENKLLILSGYWQEGLWDRGLLVFAFQMMFMLVLGYSLALTQTVSKIIGLVTRYCHTTAGAALTVSLCTMLMSLLNWGLGLVFGAILARSVAHQFSRNNAVLNYPLVGAAGYSGMMIWHGGFSASAPLKVAEADHFLHQEMGIIPVTETIFSSMNISVSFCLLIVVPMVMYFLGKRFPGKNIRSFKFKEDTFRKELHNHPFSILPGLSLSSLTGLVILILTIWNIYNQNTLSFSFITLDFVNLCLLGFSLLLHNDLKTFIASVDNGMRSAGGILIQFPLYFGIMGIMKSSGLILILSEWFVSMSSPVTYPLYTFFSAGLINIFVPSGGGQWAVQGPVIAESALLSGTSYAKAVMAMAYGDQLTNMLQPFWALPLLGITRLRASEIIPYSFLIFLAGIIIFSTALLIFN